MQHLNAKAPQQGEPCPTANGLAPLGCQNDTHSWGKAWTLLIAATALTAAACSSNTTTKATVVQDVKSTEDSGATDDNGTPTDTLDDVPDTVVAPTDANVTDGGDVIVPPTDGKSGVCLTDQQCAGQIIGIKGCQESVCDLGSGLCVAQQKKGACCLDADCDDKNPGTDDKCDQGLWTCQNQPNGKCADYVSVLDVGFEQKSNEGFKQFPDPSAQPYPLGNVSWHLETKRSHSGKSSLYLGNECNVYDTSATNASGCQSAGAGATIFTTLTFPEAQLVQGKQFVLDFWVWIDAEPMFVDGVPPAVKSTACQTNGKAGCNPGYSCIDLKDQGGGPTCLKEKDVLSIKIDGNLAWDSTQIGKNTGKQWKHLVFNLASASLAPVITAEFDTQTGGKNNYEGVYIDDVKVYTLCTGDANPLCDATNPCADDKKACTSDSCTYFANQGGKGVCFHELTGGCCEGVVDCDDKNTCTLDSCTIVAPATNGTCKNVPDTSNDQCCKAQDLFTDDFTSGGLSKWTPAGFDPGNSKTVTWHVNPTCNSGSCLYFGNDGFSSYDDQAIKPAGPKGTLCTTAQIPLVQGTVYNVLNFNLKLETEWTGQPAKNYKNPPPLATTPLDQLSVVVKPAGLPQKVWTSDAVFGTTEGQYLPINVPLDDYAGKSVQICFSFDAGDSYSNNHAGVFIDDVKIGVACKQPSCTYDADPKCVAQCDPLCETPYCAGGECGCTKTPNCCHKDADCDDADPCTTDTCNSPSCSHTTPDPKCCSDKTPFKEDFEQNGKTPTGWEFKTKSGAAQSGQYDTSIKWNVTALKANQSTYSLYFGNNGTFNAGSNVPAGDALSPSFAIPTNGTSLITFDLYLSTEWDSPALWQDPGSFVVDQLKVGLVDPTAADLKATAWIWNSYQIHGTTGGVFLSIVAAVPDVWAGKSARLVFDFDAGTPNANKNEGAYLDNIHLQSFCTKPVCAQNADCGVGNTDPCVKNYCSLDVSGTKTACKTAPQAGPTCCAPAAPPIPAQTFESGPGWDSKSWDKSGATSDGCSDVGWNVISKKKLNGQQELYFGNPAKSNYDCPGLPVSGELCSVPFQLNIDPKKSASFGWKGYYDVESATGNPELFQLVVKYSANGVQKTDVVFDKTNNDAKTGLLKPPAGQKCGGDYCTPVAKSVDLSTYKGKGNLVLCFEFDSGDSGLNDKYEGIYLDDLAISEPCL